MLPFHRLALKLPTTALFCFRFHLPLELIKHCMSSATQRLQNTVLSMYIPIHMYVSTRYMVYLVWSLHESMIGFIAFQLIPLTIVLRVSHSDCHHPSSIIRHSSSVCRRIGGTVLDFELDCR